MFKVGPETVLKRTATATMLLIMNKIQFMNFYAIKYGNADKIVKFLKYTVSL